MHVPTNNVLMASLQPISRVYYAVRDSLYGYHPNLDKHPSGSKSRLPSTLTVLSMLYPKPLPPHALHPLFHVPIHMFRLMLMLLFMPNPQVHTAWLLYTACSCFVNACRCLAFHACSHEQQIDGVPPAYVARILRGSE